MNYIAFNYTAIQSATPDLHVLAATMWHGDRLGSVNDTMELFYGASGNYPEYCDAIDFRLDWSHYHIKQMGNNDELLSAFANWLQCFGGNSIIATIKDDRVLLQEMIVKGYLTLPDSCIIVNLDTIKQLSNIESYARNCGVKPCEAMKIEGGEPVRVAAMKAKCYREVVSEFLHEQLTTTIAPLLESANL